MIGRKEFITCFYMKLESYRRNKIKTVLNELNQKSDEYGFHSSSEIRDVYERKERRAYYGRIFYDLLNFYDFFIKNCPDATNQDLINFLSNYPFFPFYVREGADSALSAQGIIINQFLSILPLITISSLPISERNLDYFSFSRDIFQELVCRYEIQHVFPEPFKVSDELPF